MVQDIRDVVGSGGKKKQKAPVEQEVSFSSKAVAYVAIAYSEGETGGLTDGGKSIYFDDTPLENSDGTVNFPGVTWEQRVGLPSQEPVPDFTEPGSVTQVDVDLKAANPFVRSVSSVEVDHVTVVMRLNGLQKTQDNGDQIGAEVSFKAEKRNPALGTWEVEAASITVKGRVISAYEIEIPVTRPTNSTGAWDYRITRLTPDSTSTKLLNDTSVSYVIERDTTAGTVTRYHNTAYVALRIDTSLFGDRIPTVSFKVHGVKVRVPSNYNEVTRAYSGIWNGTFKYAVTDNPAWHIYNLLVEGRYGLGLNSSFLNKFDFYTMAQYCDGMVPDGLGGQRPRFTLRTQINDSEDAVALINSICSAMRAGPYWGAGSVQITQDAPKATSKIANQTNVIDGAFVWRGTELAERVTTAFISWNDPDDFFRPRISKYQDDAAVAKYGIVERRLAKYGCANEHEAIAFGKYLVDSSLNETQTVTFTGSMEFADTRPGDIIEIADPMRSKSRMAGRVRTAGTSAVLGLDAPVTLSPGISYRMIYTTGDGIVNVAVTSPAGTHNTSLSLASAVAFEAGHTYIIAGSDIEPIKVRVLSVKEEESRYAIVAQEYDATKYSRTELGINVAPPITSRYTDKSIKPPGAVTFKDSVEVRNGEHVRVLKVMWDPSPSEWVVGYTIQYRRENLNFSVQEVLDTREFEILNPRDGLYDFVISAINGNGGNESQPVLASYLVGTRVPDLMPEVTGLRLVNSVDPNGTEFATPDAEFTWNHQSSAAGEFGSDPVTDGLDAVFMDYQIRIIASDFSVLRTDLTTSNVYAYTNAMNLADRKKLGYTSPTRYFTIEVKQRGRQGQISDQPARLTVSNPPPPLPNGISTTGFYQFVRLFHDPLTADAVGTIIWLSKSPNFTPGPENRAYEGIGQIHDVEAEPNTQYYMQYAVYDTFSQSDLLISGETPVKTIASEATFADPLVPTGLILNRTFEVLADGSLRSQIVATWDRPAANSEQTWWEVGVSENNGTEIVFPVNAILASLSDLPTYIITARPNTSYRVRVRAVNVVTMSGWTNSQTINSLGDSTAPAVPTGLVGAAAFKTVFLRWVNPTDDDLDHVEVYEADSNNSAVANVIARVYTDSYTRSGLATGVTKYYWLKAVDSSGNKSGFSSVPGAGVAVTTSKVVGGPDIEANSITTNLLKSSEVWADVISTGSLDAAKLKAGTILSDTITVGGTSLANLKTWATDPASKINIGTTKIDPGQILISGTSTLASWRSGGDATKIDGGKISANSIAANTLQVGDRAIEFNIEFEHNNVSTVTWRGGTVSYIDNDGVRKTATINAGSAGWNGSSLTYIGWPRNTPVNLYSTSDNPAVAMPADNWVIIATYAGGSRLVVNYGKTIIDGADIKTGTITAVNIQGLSITGDKIAGNTITGNKIQAAQITTDHIGVGTLHGNRITTNTLDAQAITTGTLHGDKIIGNTIHGDKITAGTINANRIVSSHLISDLITTGGSLQVWDSNNNRHRAWIGHRPGIDYGMWIWAADGTEIVGPSGLNGLRINNLLVDTLQIKSNAVTVPLAVTQVGSQRGTNMTTWHTLMWGDFFMPQPGKLLVSASLSQGYDPGGPREFDCEIMIDNSRATGRHAGNVSYNEAPSLIAARDVAAGWHNVYVRWRGGNSGIVVSESAMFILGAMR